MLGSLPLKSCSLKKVETEAAIYCQFLWCLKKEGERWGERGGEEERGNLTARRLGVLGVLRRTFFRFVSSFSPPSDVLLRTQDDREPKRTIVDTDIVLDRAVKARTQKSCNMIPCTLLVSIGVKLIPNYISCLF